MELADLSLRGGTEPGRTGSAAPATPFPVENGHNEASVGFSWRAAASNAFSAFKGRNVRLIPHVTKSYMRCKIKAFVLSTGAAQSVPHKE